ncbi:hypothetical protein LOD99_7585 [Oopsacas minuta]|uniref:Transmembrane protein n=1 Tax=Oopsacas minuta TaxID=111878 RepID=A0AAV7JP02_9METZ|nr:hypothetical protein LOD99_7585 [Oopsacas minuta]
MAMNDDIEVLRPIDDLQESLNYESFESESTYNIVESLTTFVQDEEDGKFPILIFVGPKVKLFRMVRLFCFFLIVLLYTVYYVNARELLISLTRERLEKDADIIIFMPAILNGLPQLLSVVFGFISDYTRYQRVYLILYSFMFSSCSAVFMMLCNFLINLQIPYSQIEQAFHILLSSSIIFYVLGLSIFLPFSLAYGLDLLQGTKWEVKYLYFPIYYIVRNLGYFGGVLRYFSFSESNLKNSYTAIFSLMISTLLLFFIFRMFRIFPGFGKPRKFDVISVRKAFEIFWNSLKVLQTGQRSPRGHWFIQLSSDAHYGKYPRKQVQMVASFFEINFLFIFIISLFITTQAIFDLFVRQAHLLKLPVSNLTEVFCTGERNTSMYNFRYINNVTIILLTPFIEYYFYKIIFFFNSSENIEKNDNKKSLWRNILRCLRCFDRYWHIYDPLLKRIFWGSIFGLITLLFALSVEISRILTFDASFTCPNNTLFNKYSTVSIFSQIPQYISSAVLEIISYIGCLQFVYFQSNNTYKDQLKGLFFGLYFFYMGLSFIICHLIFYVIVVLCRSNCGYCLTYDELCPSSTYTLTWIPYVILGIASFVVILLFAWFAHYRHYQLSNINRKGSFRVNEEG